jgi:hypothetical protein
MCNGVPDSALQGFPLSSTKVSELLVIKAINFSSITDRSHLTARRYVLMFELKNWLHSDGTVSVQIYTAGCHVVLILDLIQLYAYAKITTTYLLIIHRTA